MGSTGPATVDSPEQLRRQAAHVEAALRRRGLQLSTPVVVKLRTRAALHRSGLFTHPDQHGVTAARWQQGRASITIGLAAGMPAPLSRLVLAHEYGHAVLADRGTAQLPLLLAEGFAELVAYTYLTRDDASPAARALAAQRLANPDPVYGQGLRQLRRHVAARGFGSVWATLTSGRHDQVAALTGPAAPPSPRPTQPRSP